MLHINLLPIEAMDYHLAGISVRSYCLRTINVHDRAACDSGQSCSRGGRWVNLHAPTRLKCNDWSGRTGSKVRPAVW